MVFIFIKATGDSLLIHEFAYSIFLGLCSVTSNMTGYSHSIKLIHCGASQKDVLCDKMVLLVVTHSFYFMLYFISCSQSMYFDNSCGYEPVYHGNCTCIKGRGKPPRVTSVILGTTLSSLSYTNYIYYRTIIILLVKATILNTVHHCFMSVDRNSRVDSPSLCLKKTIQMKTILMKIATKFLAINFVIK